MTTNDLTIAAALLRLESAVAATYAAFRAVQLGPDPAREAILGHVADAIATTACVADGIPLPGTDIGDTAGLDDDGGGGGVAVR